MSERRPWLDPDEPGDILARLEVRGVRVWLSGDRLEVDAPEGALSAADREQLRRRRLDLAAHLAGRGGARGVRRSPPEELAADAAREYPRPQGRPRRAHMD